MLSLLFVMRGSKNFTSSLAVQMLPSVPIDHCMRNEANETFGGTASRQQAVGVLAHPCSRVLTCGVDRWSHTMFRYSMLGKIRAYRVESHLPALSTLVLSK